MEVVLLLTMTVDCPTLMNGAKVLLLDQTADSSNELDSFNGRFEKCDEVMSRLRLRDSGSIEASLLQ